MTDHPMALYRRTRRISQEALGKELGVTGQTVWRWENRLRVPRHRDVPGISEKTGLSPLEVLGYAKEAAE